MGGTEETWQLIGRMVVGVILVRVVEMIPFLRYVILIRFSAALGHGRHFSGNLPAFHSSTSRNGAVSTRYASAAAPQHHHRRPPTRLIGSAKSRVDPSQKLQAGQLMTLWVAALAAATKSSGK